MTRHWVAAAAIVTIAGAIAGAMPAAAKKPKLSGPYRHENLTVFFIHGAARANAGDLLTLQEAVARKLVRISETGTVSRLKIENVSDRPVFIQAGDIVKGGRQDRVVTADFILPARSGLVPIGAFCVERGRWSRRGQESASRFTSANHALPSRKLKLALVERANAAPARPQTLNRVPALQHRELQRQEPLRQDLQHRDRHAQRIVNPRGGASTQTKVWRRVAKLQQKLNRSLKTDVADKKSRTSLQLALENKALQQKIDAYAAALKAAPARLESVVGMVVVINGKVSSADVYAHPALFRKMWPKLLHAAATEAIAERQDKLFRQITAAQVAAFLEAAAKTGAVRTQHRGRTTVAHRESDKAVFTETRAGKDRAKQAWVHRNFLVK